MHNQHITRILSAVPTSPVEGRFVLGIDGLSRAGKTTLVADLEHALQSKGLTTLILHLDDFIVDRNGRYDTGHHEWYEYYGLQWDVQGLKSDLFEPLNHGATELSLAFYQPELDAHQRRVLPVPQDGVIVVEGIFLQRPAWKAHFDAMVYVDCPREARFQRESENTRNNRPKFERRYWPAEDFYLQTDKPMDGADIVLSN